MEPFNIFKSDSNEPIIKKEDYVCLACGHYHIIEYADCDYCGIPKKYLNNNKIKNFLQTGTYPFKVYIKPDDPRYGWSNSPTNKAITFLDKTTYNFNYEVFLKEITSSDFKKIVSNINPLSITLVSLIFTLMMSGVFIVILPLELSVLLSLSISITVGLSYYFRSSKRYISGILSKYHNQELETIAESKNLLNQIRDVLLKNAKKNTKHIQDLNKFKNNLSHFQEMAELFYDNRVSLLTRYDIYTVEIFNLNIDRFENYIKSNLMFSTDDYIGFIEQWMEREIKNISAFKSFASLSNSGNSFGGSTFLNTINNGNYLKILEKIKNLRTQPCMRNNLYKFNRIAENIHELVIEKKEYSSKLQSIKASIKPFLAKSWLNVSEKRELLALQEEEQKLISDIEFLDTSFNEYFEQMSIMIPSKDLYETLKKDANILNNAEYISLINDFKKLYFVFPQKQKYWHEIFTSSKLTKGYKAWLRIAKDYIPKTRMTKEYILAKEIEKHTKKIKEHIEQFELCKSELIKRIETLWDDYLYLKKNHVLVDNEKVNEDIEGSMPLYRLEGIKEYFQLDEFKMKEAKENLSEAIKNQRIDLDELLTVLKSNREQRLTYKKLTEDY